MSFFEVRVPGKWVLAGEHSVLKGATAVALPHPVLGLSLKFEPGVQNASSSKELTDAAGAGLGKLRIEPATAVDVISEILKSRAGELTEKLQGRLQIESSIPIGAGLGSSAALCVAMARWLAPYLKLSQEEIPGYATQLEHRFHGRSSGMDIAVILAGAPVCFSMKEGVRPLGVKSLPKFTFHDTGLRARTQDCVAQVDEMRQKNTEEASRWDAQMTKAAQMSREGLLSYDRGERSDREEGLCTLKEAMIQAQSCFEAWGLIPHPARILEAELMKQGAMAVKLTGAGGGGMLVALWSDEKNHLS